MKKIIHILELLLAASIGGLITAIIYVAYFG